MKPPIRERIIALPYRKAISAAEYRCLIEATKEKLRGISGIVLGAEENICNPRVSGMPEPTLDGSTPDWSKVRIGVDRVWRIQVNQHFYVQITKKSASFHFVVPDRDHVGKFEELEAFYELILPELVDVIDVEHRVERVETVFVNSFETEDLREFLVDNGSSLNLDGILNLPNITVHSEGLKPCPPTLQTINYYIDGQSDAKLRADLRIPEAPPNEWYISLVITGRKYVRLSRENKWGRDACALMHRHSLALFKTLINKDVCHSMGIDAQ